MNCRQVVELMTDYIEGTLPADDRARFEEHIAGCDGCRAYLAQMRVTRRIIGSLADVPIPETVERELLEAFRNWRQA
ncbi:MAG TPA: zf-HC2 domain-containing protein [Candidatus Dormibacteraeota bacterium]|nr:zf-HC2 domain-containing protein [Candidatus Dormibacteraeota bacterium]